MGRAVTWPKTWGAPKMLHVWLDADTLRWLMFRLDVTIATPLPKSGPKRAGALYARRMAKKLRSMLFKSAAVHGVKLLREIQALQRIGR